MSGAAAVADVMAALAARYPPEWADSGDRVGLVCGDPGAPVRRVLFAVDSTAANIAEAVAMGADLLVTHHPPPGRVVQRTAGLALYVAHTNAVVACPGVSDALAERLGLRAVRPLVPVMEQRDKVVAFVPRGEVDHVIDALAGAGAGAIGNYTRCAWTTDGIGTFLPREGARPVVGAVGQVEKVPETRVEMVLPRARRSAVVTALRAAHPYEEPAYYLSELAAVPGVRGYGRVGELDEPVTLADFVACAAARLPATASDIRAAGDPKQRVTTVAVCSGAGGRFADAAANAGADVYVTGDLSYELASKTLESGGPALVDAGHWATERPWLDVAAARLRSDLACGVSVTVSMAVTDPWSVAHKDRTS